MNTTSESTLGETLVRLLRRSPRYARLSRRLLMDSRLTAWQKAPLVAAIGYGLSSIDLVPGIVPVLGQLDDLIVLLGALRLTLDRIPDSVANEHLLAINLTKSDIDADVTDTVRAARRIVVGGVRGVTKVVRTGTRLSLKLASAGIRSLRAEPWLRPAGDDAHDFA
ncbi:MAG TPA: YkvA family protein [Nitrolancea sp.]|nr:YkvA family protein [Nitrolancea sp.]